MLHIIGWAEVDGLMGAGHPGPNTQSGVWGWGDRQSGKLWEFLGKILREFPHLSKPFPSMGKTGNFTESRERCRVVE